MKILIYGINYYPEKTGIGKFTGEMVEWLVAQGHEIIVITTPPYYPEWNVNEGYSSWLYKKELIHGAIVWRCPLWVPSQPSGIKRILHLVSFAISSLPIALHVSFSFDPDLIFVVEPPVLCTPAALLLGSFTRAKTWLHVQDFEIDAAFSLGLLKFDLLSNLILKIESYLMKKFDFVSSISENMYDKLIYSKGVEVSKTVLFPNWVDTNEIYPLSAISNFREKLGISKTSFVILYSGSLGEKQGLDILVSSAQILRETLDIVFVICGSGSYKTQLVDLSKDLNNIHFIDLQPIAKINELLNMADIHVLPQKADAADLVMPSKIKAIFSSGKPVVATAHQGTQLEKVIQARGLVVAPEDPEALTKALLYLYKNPEQRKVLGLAARNYAIEKWDKGLILKCFEDNLKKLILDKGESLKNTFERSVKNIKSHANSKK